MSFELPAYVNTLLLISAILIPAISWLGIERTAKKVLEQQAYRRVSIVTGLLLLVGLSTMMMLAMRGFFLVNDSEALFTPRPMS